MKSYTAVELYAGIAQTWEAFRAWKKCRLGLLVDSDEYVKRDDRWLIKRTSYRRVYEELQPRGNVEGLSLTASWWATDGKSKLPAG